jgi:uncharacterized protein YbaR (Trm112 family)
LENRLLEILACPICKGSLKYQRGGTSAEGVPLDGELTCRYDRLAFPIRDGIPRMLVDEARQLDEAECGQ